MTKSHIFLTSLVTFCIGIGVYTLLPYNPSRYGISAIVFLCIAVCLLLYSKTPNHLNDPTLPTVLTIPSPRTLSIFFVLSCTFFLGISRGQSTLHIPSPETIDYYTSEKREDRITIIGTIAEEVDVRRDKINYTIEVQSLNVPKNSEAGEASPDKHVLSSSNGGSGVRQGAKEFLPVTGYTLISSNKYPKYEFGDQLELTGNLQKPTVFDTFDYAGYLSRFDIYSVMYRPQIKRKNERTEEPVPTFFRSSVLSSIQDIQIKDRFISTMLNIKQSFEHHLNLTYPTEPSSSFMAGLLLGSRKGMPEQLTLDFQTTGLTHIVAISGYNITLIVTILMAIFKPFGKRLSILLSAGGIIIFTLFVGATPAVVRACIMGLIALIALNSDRKGNITIILALTAALMIGYNPKILIYDVGFQLSFLATMGLVYVSPILEPSLKWLPKKLAIRDSINLSLSAQIMALPIIVLNFQNLSIISPISNLLVAGPIIPFSMLFGFVGTITSYLSLPLAKLIAFPGYLLLEYIVQVIEITARIPYAAVQISWFSESMLLLYFIGLSALLFKWWNAEHQRQATIHQLRLAFEHRVVEQLWRENPAV